MLLSTFRKITAFPFDLNFARFRTAFLLVIILYNFTEASFKALHLLWTVFYLIALRAVGIVDERSCSAERVPSDRDADSPQSRCRGRLPLPLAFCPIVSVAPLLACPTF